MFLILSCIELSVAACVWGLPYWTGRVQNICSITESSSGQYCSVASCTSTLGFVILSPLSLRAFKLSPQNLLLFFPFPFAFQECWAWNLFHVLPSWWDYCSLHPLTGWFVPPSLFFLILCFGNVCAFEQKEVTNSCGFKISLTQMCTLCLLD